MKPLSIRTQMILYAALLATAPTVPVFADPGRHSQQPVSRPLEVGMAAPDFALPDQNGKTHRLSDYKGKTVILAFYPKDMTPG